MIQLIMKTETDYDYIANGIFQLQFKNKYSAKAWLLTMITMYPHNYDIHFEAYLMEKNDNDFVEAAKYFSYIMKTFPNRPPNMWREINAVIHALRTKKAETTLIQDFYVNMFEYTDKDVQNNLVLFTMSNIKYSYHDFKQLLLNLKRYPLSILAHSGQLLEMVTSGMRDDPIQYERIFMTEVMSLLSTKFPIVSSKIACRLFAVFCEHYIGQMIDEDKYEDVEIWRNIFQVLNMCGHLLHWQKFLPYNRRWSHRIYWEKLIDIMARCGPVKIQVIYYATTLFIYCLFCYMSNYSIRQNKQHLCHILAEGFNNWPLNDRIEVKCNELPQMSLTTPISHELCSAFVHAAQCWQLLNSDQFQMEFSALLVTLPLQSWISRFLFDLAIYFGHKDEARHLMRDLTITNPLIKDLIVLSYNHPEGILTMDCFHRILNILNKLPPISGQFIDHLTLKTSRHLLFLPLTEKAILQYCVRCIIRVLMTRLYDSNFNDELLCDLIILLQVDYPRETDIIEQIFDVIAIRRRLTFRNFTDYVITIDFIEEFMFLWNNYSDMNFDFKPNSNASSTTAPTRRTRHSEKGVRDDFRSIIKHQILRCNENVSKVLINFILTEQTRLISVICDQRYKPRYIQYPPK